MMKRFQTRKGMAITGAILLSAIVIGSVAYVQADKAAPKAKLVAGCMTKESKLPAFAKGLMYDGNGLPQTFHYTKEVGGDAPYVGNYQRAYRGANLDAATLVLAPFEKSKPGVPKVYVDKSSSCTDIYVSMAHGMFNLAVYSRK